MLTTTLVYISQSSKSTYCFSFCKKKMKQEVILDQCWLHVAKRLIHCHPWEKNIFFA